MDNQHRQIKGYRELTAHEIAMMNEIKSVGERLKELCELARANGDARWAAIGETHLQQGLMALTRAIAKPAFF